MNWDDFTKSVLAMGTGLGAIVFGYQKFSVTRKKDGTEVASEGAKTAQYELLEASIKRNEERIRELTVEFGVMDKKLHRQQRTITRMEMLLRQFSGLVSQHGITVPAYMQGELDALIEADVERYPLQEPKAFP